jgi:hypothetical protein
LPHFPVRQILILRIPLDGEVEGFVHLGHESLDEIGGVERKLLFLVIGVHCVCQSPAGPPRKKAESP